MLLYFWDKKSSRKSFNQIKVLEIFFFTRLKSAKMCHRAKLYPNLGRTSTLITKFLEIKKKPVHLKR